MLTQGEADALMAMRKRFTELRAIAMDPGVDSTHELVSEDEQERFLLDIWRGTFRLSKLDFRSVRGRSSCWFAWILTEARTRIRMACTWVGPICTLTGRDMRTNGLNRLTGLFSRTRRIREWPSGNFADSAISRRPLRFKEVCYE